MGQGGPGSLFERMLPKAMSIEEKRPAHSPSVQELEDEEAEKELPDLFELINRDLRDEAS
jgi:hypothetical protein